jgi:hypothetical protein
VLITYDPSDNLMAKDLSRRMTVPLRSGNAPTTMMFAAFWKKGWTRFSGLQLSPSDAGCFEGLSRTRDLNGLTLALNVTYPPDWRSHELYQTVADWEHVRRDEGPKVRFLPEPFSLKKKYFDGPLSPPGPATFYAPIARQSDHGGWALRGMADTPTGYLLQYGARSATAESVLVVEGSVARGGISIGFHENEQWAGYVNLVERGPFLALLKPAAAGAYKVTIADCPTGSVLESRGGSADWLRSNGLWGPPTDIVITRIGWSDPPAPVE